MRIAAASCAWFSVVVLFATVWAPPVSAQGVEVPENPIPTQVTIANREVARKLGGELDLLLSGAVRKLAEKTQDNILTDAAREEFCAKYFTPKMDASLTTEMRNALIDLDAETAATLAKKLGLPRRAVDSVLPRTRFGGMMYELEKMVRSEDSIDKVDAFARRFQISLGDFDLGRTQREEVKTAVDSIIETLRIRLAVSEKSPAAPGTQVPAPAGTLPAILYPALAPAGRLFLVGNRVLVLGKAAPGNLVVSKAQAIELLNLPRAAGKPIENASDDAAQSIVHDGTLIYNPPELGMAVNYAINDHPYAIKGDQVQKLPAGKSWVISFDRGNDTQARYTLKDGTYKFRIKDNALDVVSHTCEVALQNPSPLGAFQFVVDGQLVAIPAGRTITLKSPYPIVISFKQGTGSAVIHKKLWGGDYLVALDGAGKQWDLYPAPKATEVAADGPPKAAAGQ